MRCKHVPNMISASRAVLGIVVFFYALHGCWLSAAIFSAVAIATDCIDGWLAVRLNARSKLGSIIDPVSDLVLSAGQIAGAVFSGIIGWGLVLLIATIFIVVWPSHALIKNKTVSRTFLLLHMAEYAITVTGLMALFFYKAMGLNAIWLMLPALPLATWGAWSSIRHHHS